MAYYMKGGQDLDERHNAAYAIQRGLKMKKKRQVISEYPTVVIIAYDVKLREAQA